LFIFRSILDNFRDCFSERKIDTIMADDVVTPEEEELAMEAAREWNAKRDHLHDIFSPYYNRGCERDIALEKWGPSIEKKVEAELAKESKERGKTEKVNFTTRHVYIEDPDNECPWHCKYDIDLDHD
jgi:hypothetical protein